MISEHFDAVVVGAGMGGIYQAYRLIQLGLTVQIIDRADGPGGTWYWNRYPGAMSDTYSQLYRYSWDPEDLRTYPWTKHYVYQKEVLQYLRHVVKRYDLRKDILFETEMTEARWNDEDDRWTVTTSTGVRFITRYLITSLGLLSRQNFPDITGIRDFRGEMYHTGQWPESVKLEGKHVGVIGNGSTGVQVITEISSYVKHLVSFQRNPQYSVPSGQAEVSEQYRRDINESYSQIWDGVRHSLFGFGFEGRL